MVVIVFSEDDIGLSRYFGIERREKNNSAGCGRRGLRIRVDILGNI